MKTPVHKHEDWWREWFNHIYMDVYSHRDDLSAQEELAAVLALLPLLPKHRILDLCCGNGRHSRALRKAGFPRVVGIDYSFPLLKHAKPECPTSCFIRADMRHIPFRDQVFDAVFSFFTSFGYFQTSMENRSVLYEMSRVLQPGGWFFMDYLNPSHVRETFSPFTEKKHGEYNIKEYRSLTEDNKRIEKRIVIENWGGEERNYMESVRLYEQDEMKEMLRQTGLSTISTLGDFRGSPFSPQTPRMILFGVKTG